MTKRSFRRAHGAAALATAALILGPALSAAAAPPLEGIRLNEDGSVNCVENGWKFTPSPEDPHAPAQHCFHTEPSNADALHPIAKHKKKYPSKAAAHAALTAVENSRPMSGPDGYLAHDTFAAQPLTGDEPVSTYSHEISRTTLDTNLTKNHWATGANFGMGYGGRDSIAIFTVDSSNPAQHFVNVTTDNSAVTSSPTNEKMMVGKIPFPRWAIQQGLIPTDSGDRSIAIYDVATGIWRSMFFFEPETNSDGEAISDSFKFSSGGYISGLPDMKGLGDENYWMSLMSSTSSVAGLANELTQIGVEEVRAGTINHVVSMTWQDYQKIASFPAKLTDGQLDEDDHPYAPHVGQMFTLPAEFDVDEYVDRNGMGEFSKVYLRAVQEYGAIITDRNSVINAVNFEHPAGYAPYARHGKNVYTDDPEIAEKLAGFNINRFPYMSLDWIEVDYAGQPHAAEQDPKVFAGSTSPTLSSKQMMTTDIMTQVYQGDRAFEDLESNHTFNNGNNTEGARFYPDMVASNPGRAADAEATPEGKFAVTPAGLAFNPVDKFLGTTSIGVGPGETVNDGTGATPRRWTIKTVDPRRPLARTDNTVVPTGSTVTINPLENDDTSKGAGNEGFGSLTLLDPSGSPTSTLNIGKGTSLTVDGTSVVVDAGAADNGYLPHVEYQATTDTGAKATGYIRVAVTAPSTPDADPADSLEPGWSVN